MHTIVFCVDLFCLYDHFFVNTSDKFTRILHCCFNDTGQFYDYSIPCDLSQKDRDRLVFSWNEYISFSTYNIYVTVLTVTYAIRVENNIYFIHAMSLT